MNALKILAPSRIRPLRLVRVYPRGIRNGPDDEWPAANRSSARHCRGTLCPSDCPEHAEVPSRTVHECGEPWSVLGATQCRCLPLSRPSRSCFSLSNHPAWFGDRAKGIHYSLLLCQWPEVTGLPLCVVLSKGNESVTSLGALTHVSLNSVFFTCARNRSPAR